jgi:hypothetical protein
MLEGRRVYAHRIAFAQANGIGLSEMTGFVVRHKCDNPECVRPEHLELGTHADNVQDTVARGRHCVGEKHGMSKLTAEQAAQIRSLNNGMRGQCVRVAKMYGVTHSQISMIWSGKRRQKEAA